MRWWELDCLLRSCCCPSASWRGRSASIRRMLPPLPLLVVLFGIPTVCILGTLKVLVDRLKEIGKGEEDAYRNY